MDKTDIAVGDSTRIEIIFDTKTYASKVSKRPSIETNEGPPEKHVSISATIVPRPDSTYPIIINPYKVDLSQLGEKVINESPIVFKNVSDQNLEVSLIATEGAHFELDLPKSIPAGGEASGKVTLKQEAYGNSFEKSFTIELAPAGGDAATKTRFTVPVKRTVRVANQAATRVLPPRDGQ